MDRMDAVDDVGRWINPEKPVPRHGSDRQEKAEKTIPALTHSHDERLLTYLRFVSRLNSDLLVSI